MSEGTSNLELSALQHVTTRVSEVSAIDQTELHLLRTQEDHVFVHPFVFSSEAHYRPVMLTVVCRMSNPGSLRFLLSKWCCLQGIVNKAPSSLKSSHRPPIPLQLQAFNTTLPTQHLQCQISSLLTQPITLPQCHCLLLACGQLALQNLLHRHQILPASSLASVKLPPHRLS